MMLQELLALSKITVYDTNLEIRDTTPRIHCMNGESLSVQAGEMHYCEPRTNRGPWHQVDVGYPSQKFEALMPWAECSDTPTSTVYGCVPIEIVEAVIESCGGICVEMTLLKKGDVA